MKWIAALALLVLAGCQHAAAPPPSIVYRDVLVPTRVHCVTADQIPAEPPMVGGQLTGNAAEDIGPISIAAIETRKALRLARALLLGCVKPSA